MKSFGCFGVIEAKELGGNYGHLREEKKKERNGKEGLCDLVYT